MSIRANLPSVRGIQRVPAILPAVRSQQALARPSAEIVHPQPKPKPAKSDAAASTKIVSGYGYKPKPGLLIDTYA